LPQLSADVSSGDGIRGGVALRADDAEIAVHPYTLRIVCSNGAIRAEAVQTRVVKRSDQEGDRLPTQILCELREAVRACATPQAFDESIRQMRGAMEQQAEVMLMALSFLSRAPSEVRDRLMAQIMSRFHSGGDRSRYGLMNAVTATARNTRDPEVRWRLEELGGAVPALIARPITPRPLNVRTSRAARSCGRRRRLRNESRRRHRERSQKPRWPARRAVATIWPC
jgi:hypothetical protein